MDLRDIEATLPPGFRFCPSDEELVCHYLCKKISNERLSRGTMVEIDLHTCEPWQLPDVAKLGANEWYFFSFRERKYSTGLRTNRATKAGYWKATGKDRTVLDSTTSSIVGMRKTLVFYRGRAPNGIKTGWIMHEFRLQMPHLPSKDWVLCRVSYKSQGGGEGDQLPTNFTIDNDLDVTAFASSPPTGQTMQEGQCQQQYISFSQTPLYQQETNHQGCLLETSTLINPSFAPECGGENEYGFLYNMELQD